MFVVKVTGKDDTLFKTFEGSNDATDWAVGKAFDEFGGNVVQTEVFETSAAGVDEVKAGTARSIGVMTAAERERRIREDAHRRALRGFRRGSGYDGFW